MQKDKIQFIVLKVNKIDQPPQLVGRGVSDNIHSSFVDYFVRTLENRCGEGFYYALQI